LSKIEHSRRQRERESTLEERKGGSTVVETVSTVGEKERNAVQCERERESKIKKERKRVQ
jgi:hypothetical protein